MDITDARGASRERLVIGWRKSVPGEPARRLRVRMISAERSMDELMAVAGRVAARLVEQRFTIAVCESSTGGLIATSLLMLPGASRYFLGGAVVYTAAARSGLLGITADEMAGMRPASEAYARLLARTARQRLGADWALAETGATGPTGNRYGDAAGHACFAVSGGSEAVRTLETGSSDRGANMRAFAIAALALLETALGEPTS
jgi:nicotinamide-nucleotide amidase